MPQIVFNFLGHNHFAVEPIFEYQDRYFTRIIEPNTR